jgi:hypothetical protein
MAMTAAQILAATPEAPWTPITIDEWGGDFLLKPLTGSQAEEIALLNVQAKETGNLLCMRGLCGRVAAWTVCSLEREPLFTLGDATTLTERHLAACMRIYPAVLQANGLSGGAAALEAAAKNSASSQS